jgi:hypothetical protein
MLMEIDTRERGEMIKLTDMVLTCMLTGQNMLDFGKMTCNMVMVKKLGLMDHSLKENI